MAGHFSLHADDANAYRLATTARALRDSIDVRLCAAILNLIQIKNPVPKSRPRRNRHVKDVSLSLAIESAWLIRSRLIVKAWFVQFRKQTGIWDGRSGCPRGAIVGNDSGADAAPTASPALGEQRVRHSTAVQRYATYFVEHTSWKASTICSLYECL